MHGYVKSFYVEEDRAHVIMTVHDPSEDQDVTVRVSKTTLESMLAAAPYFSAEGGPQQLPTPQATDAMP